MGFNVKSSGNLSGDLTVSPKVTLCPCCGSETYHSYTTTTETGVVLTASSCLRCRDMFCQKCYNSNLP